MLTQMFFFLLDIVEGDDGDGGDISCDKDDDKLIQFNTNQWD